MPIVELIHPAAAQGKVRGSALVKRLVQPLSRFSAESQGRTAGDPRSIRGPVAELLQIARIPRQRLVDQHGFPGLDKRPGALYMRVPVARVNNGAIDLLDHFIDRRKHARNAVLCGELPGVFRRMHRSAIPHPDHFMPQLALDRHPLAGVGCIQIDDPNSHPLRSILFGDFANDPGCDLAMLFCVTIIERRPADEALEKVFRIGTTLSRIGNFPRRRRL